jgi:signal transduction histidine kinase
MSHSHKSKEELIREIEARDDTFAGVAHDLRNPLGTINMCLSYISQESEISENKKLLRVLDAGSRALQKANRLVEELLDVSRLEGYDLRLECGPINLSHLMAEIVGDARHDLPENISLFLETDKAVGKVSAWADPYRLKRIIWNLITNATKFTDEGAITISLENDGDIVTIKVHDTGSGIPAEQLEEIFDRYKKLGHNKTGIGLGLYLSRAFARLMSGDLTAESTLDEGSTFILTLPASPPL